jgi:ATP-dependent RNA helicase DBP3
MSKRKYDEAEAPAIDNVVDSQVVKKVRKVKDDDKKKRKEERKARTEEKSVRQAEEAGAGGAGVTEVADDAKKLKKAQRKAERLAAAASAAAADSEQTPTAEDEDGKAAKRAAKKAAKAAKKAKQGLDDTTASATPVNGISAASSVGGESKGASSATSPEPSMSAKPARPMSSTDAASYLADNQITIDEDPSVAAKAPLPITDFAHLPFTSDAERAPFSTFKAPTPIQAAAWPYLLAGRDVIGVAETGSGKTWAFGVPCIKFIKDLPKDKRRGVKAVMISPTRELALQIQEQIEKLAGPAKLRSVCVYGGVDKDPQRTALKKASVVVATPGRLKDLLEEGSADISTAQYVVLDEADRMLDKGFEEDVRQIISQTSTDRQTLMFTATWPPSVRDLAATFMKTPVKIIIGDNPTGELRANTRIKQLVEVIAPDAKNGRLMQLLKQHQSGSKRNDRILVFCLYKKEAQRVHQFLQGKGFKVAGIHGDMSQAQRINSLDEFKAGRSTLLVATDVAARGLDIPAVKVVINVTFPLTAEDYVHRIGRTGRAGQDGLAITLFTEHDKANSGA